MTDEEIKELISNETIDIFMNCRLKPEKFTAYSLDPAAMLHVITENRISLIAPEQRENYWIAQHFKFNKTSEHEGYAVGTREVIDYVDENPLRAAAIVYLKIKGVL